MIQKVKHIIVYDPKCLVDEIMKAVETMESEGLEVEIQYSSSQEIYSALIIGRKNVASNRSKTIR